MIIIIIVIIILIFNKFCKEKTHKVNWERIGITRILISIVTYLMWKDLRLL